MTKNPESECATALAQVARFRSIALGYSAAVLMTIAIDMLYSGTIGKGFVFNSGTILEASYKSLSVSDYIFAIAFPALLVSAVPSFVVVLIGELFTIRKLYYYAISAGLIGVFAVALIPRGAVDSVGFAIATFILFGTTYWFVAVRSSPVGATTAGKSRVSWIVMQVVGVLGALGFAIAALAVFIMLLVLIIEGVSRLLLGV